MCGPPRPSSGGRIAVLFPSSPSSSPTQSPSINSYSILFHNHKNPDAKATKATFRVDNTDIDNLEMLRESSCIDLRIEYASLHLSSPFNQAINRPIWIIADRNRKYGDLTSSPTFTSPPLHAFRLRPRLSAASKTEMECELPERLDLGVSDRGIVGRQVTVVADGRMGMGVVGFD